MAWLVARAIRPKIANAKIFITLPLNKMVAHGLRRYCPEALGRAIGSFRLSFHATSRYSTVHYLH